MSSIAKWQRSFQKTRSMSETSPELTRKSSLLSGDSISDDELQKYLKTINKNSGLNRLWTGSTFDRMLDKTPDVSISSVSDGELVPIDGDKNTKSDDDFLPNILALPFSQRTDEKSDTSKPSSIEPFQALNFLSDLSQASFDLENDLKSSTQELVESMMSDVAEIETVDEISEEIQEEFSSKQNSINYSTSPERVTDSAAKSEQITCNETEHSPRKTATKKQSTRSGSSAKLKHSSRYGRDEHGSSRIQSNTPSQHSGRSKHSTQKNKASSQKDEHFYATDFSEPSEQTKDLSSKQSSIDATSSFAKNTSTTQDRMNQHYHNVATQVNMAALGPSHASNYVDPSPIAHYVVSADAIQGMTAYNPATVALTDMLRQQLTLVEQFVDNSRRIYKSSTYDLNTSYRYTTLEDTLQFIDENKDQHNLKIN